MLRLIIVDDERITRELISKSIDWEKLDINVIGICKNGFEAYDMIIDEVPDIVITDINMPGLSGLQLIEQLAPLDLNIEFVILSGYSDFTFATQAMKYGVQHYLLKPCSEEEINSVMKEVILKCHEKFSLKQLQDDHQRLLNQFENYMTFNTICSALCQLKPLEQLLPIYTPYLDVEHTPYTLYQIHPLQEAELDYFLSEFSKYRQHVGLKTCFFHIYTKDQLNMFFKSKTIDEDSMTAFDHFIHNFFLSLHSNNAINIQLLHFKSLSQLLSVLIEHLNQYDILYIIKNNTKYPIHNYMGIAPKYNNYSFELPTHTVNKEEVLQSILDFFSHLDDITLIKSSLCNFLLKNYFDKKSNYTSVEMLQLIAEINICESKTQILTLVEENFYDFYSPTSTTKYKAFIERILDYINLNFSNPKLTLKWIAEHYLYMNVDYVSKQFVKQTGIKFSTYLTKLRIEKAQNLLLEKGIDKIYEVAELTGFGNNPQYFSQTFKKNTGLTPTEFINQHSSRT